MQYCPHGSLVALSGGRFIHLSVRHAAVSPRLLGAADSAPSPLVPDSRLTCAFALPRSISTSAPRAGEPADPGRPSRHGLPASGESWHQLELDRSWRGGVEALSARRSGRGALGLPADGRRTAPRARAPGPQRVPLTVAQLARGALPGARERAEDL